MSTSSQTWPVVVMILGPILASACGSSGDAPPSEPPSTDASDAHTGGKGGVSGSGGSQAGSGGIAGKDGGTAGSGGQGGESGSSGTGGVDAGPAKDAATEEASVPASRTGYVVLSTMNDSVDGLHATWVRAAFFSGNAPTPPSCTTDTVGSCTVSDCPDDLPTASSTLSAGTLTFSGGSFALNAITPGTDGKYSLDDGTPATLWFNNPPLITLKATGDKFPAFQLPAQPPTFVNNGASPIDVHPSGSTIHLHAGTDATFNWLNGTAGDTFVVEIFTGHTWDFRDIPLPNVVRFQCPSELGTGVLPAAWVDKLKGQTFAFLSFTERRTTQQLTPETSVTAVLRLGAIHSPLGEVYVDNCTPACAGKQCGDDGCNGSCGKCGGGQSCLSGTCCTPSCAGKQCGDNGCGGSCGTCGIGTTCSSGTCVSTGCDPVANTGCVGGEGCWVLSSEKTTCALPGSGTQGSTCSTTSNCAGGYGCFAYVCRKICELANGDGCSPTETCTGVSGWSVYGACQQ